MSIDTRSSKIHDYIGHDLNHGSIIRTEYSPYANNQLQQIKKNGINDQAVRRVYQEWISIDWIESLDLDDAIWCERTNSWYVVFVHISDVTEAISHYSPLDLEALKRTTSIYRSSWVINMFPEYLSQNLLSLNEDWNKLTMTLRVELNNYWEIQNFLVYESIFKNLKRYNYEDFMDDFINPDSKNHETIQLMFELASKRKKLRKISWAIQNFDDSERNIHIWKKQEKSIQTYKWIPKIIIEEFMILANIARATIWVKNGLNTIFRNHFTLDEWALYLDYMKMHKWLALDKYTHFTSPIRRYADIIVHRILKIVHLRWEESPYSRDDIQDISHHINQVRTVIKTIWSTIDLEQKWVIKLAKLKSKNPNRKLNTSDFTKDIREKLWNKQKLPSIIKQEIINDILSWDKWAWAWAIWVFLVAWDNDIKDAIKKAILIDKKFSSKSIISILNNTKILNTDKYYLFDIKEIIKDDKISIVVNFRWEKLFIEKIEINNDNKEKKLNEIRFKVIKLIINNFC